jgi:hypothetical protein
MARWIMTEEDRLASTAPEFNPTITGGRFDPTVRDGAASRASTAQVQPTPDTPRHGISPVT